MTLNIHFLNVGQDDYTIIDSPSGDLTVVDINNGKTLDASTRDEVVAHYTQTIAAEQHPTAPHRLRPETLAGFRAPKLSLPRRRESKDGTPLLGQSQSQV